jgi:hypothetical protein
MNLPPRNRFEISESVDAAARNEIYRFRYRIYVEQMGLRQNTPITCASESLNGSTKRAHLCDLFQRRHRWNDLRQPLQRFAIAYYRKLYQIDGRFPFCPNEMTLTTKLMFDPALRRSFYPIRLIVHYARDFNARRPCKIDFIDCRRWLLPFFLKLGYVDCLGWVISQRIWQRPTAVLPGRPGTAASTVAQSNHRLARDLCDNNMFGGKDLIRRLALVERRATGQSDAA